MTMLTKLTTRGGLVEVRTANGRASISIEHPTNGNGLGWTLDSTGYMAGSPQADAATERFDQTALHLKAIFDALQSIADGDLLLG